MLDGAASIISTGTDTVPKLLLEHGEKRPNSKALRAQIGGKWQTWHWSQMIDETRLWAGGLAALGFKHGDRIILMGRDRAQLYWAMAAAQLLGGVPVLVHEDCPAPKLAAIIDHEKARFAVIDDQDSQDWLLPLIADTPLAHLIQLQDDLVTAQDGPDSPVQTRQSLHDQGQQWHQDKPDFFAGEAGKGRGSDLAVTFYSADPEPVTMALSNPEVGVGPQGLSLTFDNVLVTARAAGLFDGVSDKAVALAHLPISDPADHLVSYAQHYLFGFQLVCAGHRDGLIEDLRATRPTYLVGTPATFITIVEAIKQRRDNARLFNKWRYRTFLNHAENLGQDRLTGQGVSWGRRLVYWFGQELLYGGLKKRWGLDRLLLAYGVSGRLADDTLALLHGLRVTLKQIYGPAAASVFVTIPPSGYPSAYPPGTPTEGSTRPGSDPARDQARPRSTGLPLPGVELKIGPDNRVLIKSPGIAKNPVTQAAIKGDGWYQTDDQGYVDADGQLIITRWAAATPAQTPAV
ncbi:MAG: AMP-binding protein [Pseudomonadota bacterium]